MEEILKVENIRKTFKLSAKQKRINKTNETVKVAVDGLSFSAVRGEIYGLLGPNGAGKTTTLRIISSLIKADQGNVLVDGASVVKEPEKVRGKIGFLTSELKLEDFFTPNYLFDFFSDLHRIPKDIANERKERLFKKFGVEGFKEVKIADLSTGMKQKISLIISIVHDPEIIIFDEPTNGLDEETVQRLVQLLIREKGHRIFIIVSHDKRILDICDEEIDLDILGMQGGKMGWEHI